MNDEELVKRYVDAARQHGKAMTRPIDSDRANQMSDIICERLKVMRQRPDRERTLLEPLLDNKDASVRCWAATHFLSLDESRAVAVLEFISRMKGVIGFTAEMVLQEWRIGRLALL
ncbi:MAG: DUF2019 domain-containing protein [Eggerthellaceae bacterium]|nr:DUF2019 domain-containing protein [Eggerthellaceae bacterium]